MSIDQLFPTARQELTDEQLLTLYAPRTADDGAWLRMNFVTSLDGAVAVDGVSGSLGGPGDFRVFELQRYLADVVLVGAGTVRDEGYGAMVLPQEATRWRADHGLTDHPVFALISGSADLSPESETFSRAPVRPLVFVSADADEARRDALAEVADVVIASVPGGAAIDPRIVRAHLVSRGLTRIHGEGGPRVFGSFLEAGVVDELCLTMAPKLLAGRAGRISASESSVPTHMDLASVLRSEDELLLRYIRK
ncbi:pyrimidine reductase family protein [Kocuria koreensis]|jgi:riboflavin biosynthesis pyrimidine reductase|uniref:Pyrimidine reductase family protein n=1 Tax=Rothia koreensis TaxID=592378 RepID=A0A7K1LK95_9MICC|nr:pyrimidine reductase family protein [Rothia koreensis]MUN55618.1 pyrimidine reductase family protein [Rothia koreensis]